MSTCVCLWVCKLILMMTGGGQKSIPVSSSITPHFLFVYVLRSHLSLKLKFNVLTRLTGSACLFPAPSLACCGTDPCAVPTFYMGSGHQYTGPQAAAVCPVSPEEIFKTAFPLCSVFQLPPVSSLSEHQGPPTSCSLG